MEEQYNSELEKIKAEPFNYICNYVEELYPFMGKEAFEIISLMPCSLYIPQIPYLGKIIRSNINLLLLSPPSGGKSSICSFLAHICDSPIEGRSYTPAALEDAVWEKVGEVEGMNNEVPQFELIIEDFSKMANDENVLKIIEGILGEEQIIDKHIMTKVKGQGSVRIDKRAKVKAIGLICGVPSEITKKLSFGTIFRTAVLIMIHDEEQHSKIGKHISERIGIEKKHNEYLIVEKVIKDYYTLLKKIQDSDKKIKGFSVNPDFNKKIYERWNEITQKYISKTSANYFRELHEGYRIMISHAFLNYFKREIKDNQLIVTEEDFQVGIRLMEHTLEMKYFITTKGILINNIKTPDDYTRIINSPKIPTIVKKLIKLELGDSYN